MPPTPDVDVVLYGATGYTGRLIAHHLDSQNVEFAIAGRSEDKLAALAGDLDSNPEAVAIDVADGVGLERLASRAECLLSAAGPFVDLGPPLVRAAVKAGTHFADITGEQSYMRWCHDEVDAEARAAGISVVNALGFDVVPSDLAAVLACRDNGPVESLDIGIASSSGLSAGTKRSMAANAGKGSYWDNGEFKPGPPGRFRRTFRFPDPVGERAGVFIPWGDCVTAPRSTGARRVRTFFRVPSKQAQTMNLAWPVTYALSKVPLVRGRLAAGAPPSGEGPSPRERRESTFAIVAEATREDGRVQRAEVTGRDPYGLTGASAALASVILARGEVEATGVLTPSQALDLEAFCKALDDFDVSWRVTSA